MLHKGTIVYDEEANNNSKVLTRSCIANTEDEAKANEDDLVNEKDTIDIENADNRLNEGTLDCKRNLGETRQRSKRRSIFNQEHICSPEQEHLGQGRQYWRDIILGVNDGKFYNAASSPR